MAKAQGPRLHQVAILAGAHIASPRDEQWSELNTIWFQGNCRRRNFRRRDYFEKSFRRLWITMSRARKNGQLETWHLVSNRNLWAEAMTQEYGYRFCCFAEARVEKVDAWLRLVALFAIALLVLTVLGTTLLLCAQQLLQRITSPRTRRTELDRRDHGSRSKGLFLACSSITAD